MAVLKAIIFLLVVVLVPCTAIDSVRVLDLHSHSRPSGHIVSSGTAREGGRMLPQVVPSVGAPVVYDITQFGAKGDGKFDNFKSITKAWRLACRESAVPSKMLIPPGTFKVGQIILAGPCKTQVTIEVQGNVLADPNASNYESPEWFLIEDVIGLVLTGPGTFDGQGARVWRFTNCDLRDTANCAPAPTTLKFENVTNAVVNGISSVNPKMFHVAVSGCNNFQASGLKLTAPANSPHTVGFDISASRSVAISNTVIATGGNCLNVAPDTVGFTQIGVTCVNNH